MNEDELQLDPLHAAQDEFEQNHADYHKGVEEEIIENEQKAKQAEQEQKNRPWSYNVPVLGKIKEVGDQAALGVGDFAFDAIGLVPWLKPVDQWWDNNSPRSKHPSHKLIRDASSVIIPSMVGGGAVVGGAKAATQAMKIPTYAKVLGSAAAYAGVDTSVAMISSHSKTDDNLAGTLNNWLGWQIPWATRDSDSPDVRWKKNVYESAGLSAGVELLGAAFTFAKKAKLFPRDGGAEQVIRARQQQLELFDNPASAAIEPRRNARAAAQADEAVEAIKADPLGEKGYNAFVNEIGPDDAGKAVVNLEPDPLMSKLDQVRIQNNIGTKNGRAAPVADEAFNRKLMSAVKGSQRAKQLDKLFDSISPNFDAIVSDGVKDVKITSEQMNRSIDNLTNAIYGKELSFKEFEFIVDDMKTTVFNSNQILDEEQWIIASKAFKNAYDRVFDPNQMRASAMIAQNAADNVADLATAARMIGDEADTTRQMELIFKKLNLLGTEMKANEFIVRKAQEYKNLVQAGDVDGTVRWMNRQADNFDEYLAEVKVRNNKLEDELNFIAKNKPNYLKPFKEIYDATNGKVDDLDKMHRFVEKHIGVIKNGIIDQDPEVPSMIIRGLHGARINGVLAGMAPLRAAIGNSTLTVFKPIAAFAGAAVSNNRRGLFKRAWATYGGIGENFQRAFKVMSDEWRLANAHPEEAMMRGRADLRLAQMQKMEYMDSVADAWRLEGEFGKVAMWNTAKGLTWWTKQQFVKYGTNALYAIDGFTNSFMASGMARARAYDELFEATGGSINFEKFQEAQRRLYSEAFDDAGVLTDTAAKHASREIALNLDNDVVRRFETFLDSVPAAKTLFLFPRTGVNATELAWSFNPMSNLGPALTRARRVLGATTEQSKLSALAEHGITPEVGMNMDLAFESLKAEYIGRQLMGSTVVMGLGMWAIEGNMTGSGSHDKAERARMMAMGWKPWSIKNPVTGEWRSYKGFEPFDTLMGLTADAVYQANRVDEAVTQDFFTKIAASIGMNITNGTFIQGFEPLVGLLSRDASAWNRFWAGQIDLTIPYKGPRSILNNLITPQLKDVENDMTEYLKNANKFLFSGNEHLKDLLDVYTGKPIRDYETLTNAVNAFLPMFKSNGGMEPWRQWLLSTGWDGLQRMRKNPETGLDLSTEDRHYINNYIAENGNLANQLIDLMMQEDDYWDSELKAYVKSRGLKDQSQYPAKKTLLYRRLDEIHDRAFEAAVRSLNAYKSQYTVIGREMQNRDIELGRGAFNKAEETQKRIQNLLFETRQK